MEISNECARKILFEIEKIPCGESITVAKLQEKTVDYSMEEVIQAVTNFGKDNFYYFMTGWVMMILSKIILKVQRIGFSNFRFY